MDDHTDMDPPQGLAQFGLDGFAPYLMNRIMGRYNADLRGQMAALGLSTAKMRALATLATMDGLTINQLAVYAVVEQSTLSRALEGLTTDGLVRRETDAQDSRVTHIHLTMAGRAAFEQLWPHMQAAVARMFQGISADEQAAFLATLNKMLANIRKHEF